MARSEPGSDEALLRAVAAGDAGALTRLYERHGGALFGYLYRLAGDRMTAEEILQDTMLAVWRSAAAFEGRSKATTWLFGVARRQAHNRLRCRSGPETVGVPLPDRPDQGAGPDELAIAAAGGTPVAAAVDRLPEHHRDVIAPIVPGLLSVAAFALAVPLIMPAPLFRVVFVGYWLWGNVVAPDMMPTLARTLVHPLGGYPLDALLDFHGIDGDDTWAGPVPGATLNFLRPDPTPTTAWLSVAVLLVLAAAALAGGHAVRARRA